MFELKTPFGTSYKIAGSVVRLGRAADNTIVVNEATVSRYHINFYIKEGRLIAEDAGSANGFLVNGQNVRGSAKQLSPGDRVYVGSTEYVVSGPAPTYKPEAILGRAPPVTPSRPAPLGRSQRQASSNTAAFVLSGSFLALIGGLIFKGMSAPPPPARQPASDPGPAVALPSEGYKSGDRNPQKSLSEVEAEAKFREAMRDYDNGNYSRAMVGLREALTLNPAHENAAEYLQEAENRLRTQLQDLLKDGERSAANMQYHRARGQMLRVLTILSEQVPGYGRKIASEALTRESTRSPTQEENLLGLPCDRTKEPKVCSAALDLLKRARQALGEEETIK